MRTAVSIPDRLFERAEALAERTGKSRSRLYREALAEYLLRHEPESITEAMNRVVDALRRGRPRGGPPAARRGRAADAPACRMVVGQGDVFRRELADPIGSGPGCRRPVAVVRGDRLDVRRLATVRRANILDGIGIVLGRA